ncbi:MAG: hypothetical protein K2K84_03230, partial [Muribaculaceae bacterium]|nr:hypothetical protein [Muribaculaceae bacterium]
LRRYICLLGPHQPFADRRLECVNVKISHFYYTEINEICRLDSQDLSESFFDLVKINNLTPWLWAKKQYLRQILSILKGLLNIYDDRIGVNLVINDLSIRTECHCLYGNLIYSVENDDTIKRRLRIVQMSDIKDKRIDTYDYNGVFFTKTIVIDFKLSNKDIDDLRLILEKSFGLYMTNYVFLSYFNGLYSALEENSCRIIERAFFEEIGNLIRNNAKRKIEDLSNSLNSRWDKLIDKFPYKYFIPYYPTTSHVVGNQVWADRYLVWDFKNDPERTEQTEHLTAVNFVIDKIKTAFL